jgi:hypothetical protein
VFKQGDIVDFVDQKEQWVEEVKAWFQTAFLNARFSLLQIVRRNGPPRDQNATHSMVPLCRLILFQSNDYTNVDFIGLMAVISTLLLICAVSFAKQIKGISISFGKLCLKWWKKFRTWCWNTCSRGLFYLWSYVDKVSRNFSAGRQQSARFPFSRFWHGHEDIELPDRSASAP